MISVEDLGRQVLERRKQLRVGQEELANLSGVSARSIYALEHGKQTIRVDTLIAIAGTLGLELKLETRA